MKSELSDIFQVRLVVKNMVFESPGTHFMHFRVNKIMLMAAIDAGDRELRNKLNEKLEKLAIGTKNAFAPRLFLILGFLNLTFHFPISIINGMFTEFLFATCISFALCSCLYRYLI